MDMMLEERTVGAEGVGVILVERMGAGRKVLQLLMITFKLTQ